MTPARWLDLGPREERIWQKRWAVVAVGLSIGCWYRPGWSSGLAPWPAGTGHEGLLLLVRGAQLTLLVGAAYLAVVVFPLGAQGATRRRKMVLLLATAAAVTGVVIAIESAARASAALGPTDGRVIMAQAAMFFAALSAAGQIIRGRGRLHTHELDELRLRAELTDAELRRAQAELRMLRREMNPHFMFNALQSVQALILRDPPAAARAVVRLGDVLREALRQSETQEIALADEMELLRPFLEFEEMRLDGPLSVDWAVAEEALAARVPHLVLPPLLENAVKHGIAGRAGGQIRVRAARRGEWLEIEVTDDGDGLRPHVPAAEEGAGIGLANTRRRLQALYGDAHSFQVSEAAGGGTTAALRIPFHTASLSLPPAATPA